MLVFWLWTLATFVCIVALFVISQASDQIWVLLLALILAQLFFLGSIIILDPVTGVIELGSLLFSL